MLNRDQIQKIVYRAIDRVNEVLLDENAMAKEDGTVLMGEGASLDSMGFVNFVVALEEELAAATRLNLNVVERLNTTAVDVPRIRTIGEIIDFLRDQETDFLPNGNSSPSPRENL